MAQHSPVIGTGLPPAPYTGYTPAPGVIPPTEAPQVQTHWCQPTNKCVVTASQPIIPVPVTQEIHKKEKIVEVDQTIVTDKVVPKLYHQEVFYEVPKLLVDVREKRLDVPKLQIVEEPREINVAVGFNFKIQPIWDLREVPRIFPRYGGKQEVIEVGIPQVQIVDKKVENEVPIYVGEKTVDKEVIEEQGVEVVQYKYVRKEEEVPVYKYRPVFDVDVSIPPPVVIPIPVAPEEKALEAEHIPYSEYKQQILARQRCGGFCAACAGAGCSKCCRNKGRAPCGSPPVSPPFTPKLQRGASVPPQNNANKQ